LKFDQERSRENLKYADLTIEIQRIWNVNMKVISVITGETEIISKSFIKHLNNAPGEHKIKELQKIAILGTAYILRKAKLKIKLSHYRSGQALRDLGRGGFQNF
jgi:hypothetical protein